MEGLAIPGSLFSYPRAGVAYYCSFPMQESDRFKQHIYGDSEELVGKWLKRTGNRDKILLGTKFGVFLQHAVLLCY